MTWALVVSPKAQKEVDRVVGPDRARLLFRLWEIRLDPYAFGTEKVVGTPFRRARQGNWRIIYSTDPARRIVKVVKIARRNERTYDGLN